MTTDATDTQQPAVPQGEVIAKAAGYYRMTRYIMAAACLVMGLWFGYDGFINWPQGNVKYEQIRDDLNSAQTQMAATSNQAEKDRFSDKIRTLSEEQKQYKFHTNMDLLFQKTLFCTLPPAGIVILAICLYRSRGRYQLSNQTLSVPGHPPITLDQITHIDKRLWDRKGIAYLDYEASGTQGTITLDDFIYDRPPTDEIFKRIEDYLRASSPAPTVPRASTR